MLKVKKTVHRLLVLVLLCIFGQVGLRAQSVNDSVTVSLLTCSPGDLVYELYGHTAVLVSVPGKSKADSVVYNYGVFDFTQPNFIWRFMVGKTDYMVQPIPYWIFKKEYQQRGSEILCQEINLTIEEAVKVFCLLEENCQTKNRFYRYNFLTCNCTTKARDIIEAGINGTVRYKEQDKKTYRESLHAYTQDSPWAQLGDDVLLGAQTDTLLTDRSMQFLPYHLKDYFDGAVICDERGGDRGPMVRRTMVLLPKAEVAPEEESFPLTPFWCAIILLAVLLAVMALEYVLKCLVWGVDLLLMPAIGAAGCVVCFMFFVSEHPTMGSNWQIWVFNPVPLFCMPWVVWCAIKRRRCVYHYANAAILALFLVAFPWIPQTFSVITIPLALALLTRPLSYIINFDRLKSAKTVKNVKTSRPVARRKK